MTNDLVMVALSLFELTQHSVHAAYLDPGAGSLIFQALAGAALASLFTVKMFWYRVKTFVASTILRRGTARPDDDLE